MILVKFRKILLALVAVVMLGVVVAGCGQTTDKGVTQVTNRKIRVVTTTDFYGEVAKAVVGNRGTVTAVIHNPAVDPHDYEPTTKVASEVSKADLVVANGLNYDAWMTKLTRNSHHSEYIRVGEDVLNKKTGANPHIWYQPTTMAKYATYLATELGKVQPKSKAYFQRNAKRYIQSLKPVNQQIKQLKQNRAQQATREVYVSEPVFDYAIQALGYHVGNHSFEEAVEKGTDPSPKAIHAMQDGIKARKIAFFVDNKQVSSKTVRNFVTLAKQNDIPVLKVTETLPANMTYKQWMLSQYQDLAQILAQNK